MAKKVLVVDDEKLIVKGIRFSLEQDGMEVDCAYDGEEALKMATENAYDMILLDIMLPKMDGFEVCQHIREFSNMPIVMLTAKGDDMDKILGLEYGADHKAVQHSGSEGENQSHHEKNCRIAAQERRIQGDRGGRLKAGLREQKAVYSRQGGQSHCKGVRPFRTARE